MRFVRIIPPAARLAAVLTVTLLAVACGSSGRELREPEPGAVSPTRSVSTTVPVTTRGSVTAPLVLGLTSSAFAPGDPIPEIYSCDGPSPPLSWTVPPFPPAELALVVEDPDAGGFVHWIVVGIAARSGSTEAGGVPAGGRVLPNSAGTAAWFGPCPPPGTPHTYNFTLYGLKEAPAIAAGTPARQVADQLRAMAGDRNATITGTYQR